MCLFLCGLSMASGPQESTSQTPTTEDNQAVYEKVWDTAKTHLSDIWNKGDYEVFVPFWSQHLAFAYSAQERASFTEYPAGGGIGKGYYNQSGNWEGIYALAYHDSYGLPEYQIGYGWIPTWHPFDEKFRVGVGGTAFVFFRSNYSHYAPLPLVLPVGSIGYGPVDVQVAYIPGANGHGNVLFWWAKYTFAK